MVIPACLLSFHDVAETWVYSAGEKKRDRHGLVVEVFSELRNL